MPLIIPDDALRAREQLSEQEAKVEISCKWFDMGRLTIGHAAHLAGLSEIEFEAQLQVRGIPRFRYTEEMLQGDVQTLKKLGRW